MITKRVGIHYRQLTFLLSIMCSIIQAVPYYSIRSQSEDTARELVGWAHEIDRYQADCCDNYWTFASTFEYTRSFRSEQIARCIFDNECLESYECPTIKISGSRVENRGNKDWLADYFGLPVDFESTITFNPRIENYLVDFNW